MKASPTRPVSALEAHLGFWLRLVSNQVSARFQRLLEDRDASVTEWVALRTLLVRPETANADLIRALGITKGATSKVVGRLEEKGLVTRRFADGSARRQMLRLTKQGAALVPRLAALADENDEHYFGHLADSERRLWIEALQSLATRHRIEQPPLS